MVNKKSPPLFIFTIFQKDFINGRDGCPKIVERLFKRFAHFKNERAVQKGRREGNLFMGSDKEFTGFINGVAVTMGGRPFCKPPSEKYKQ